MNKFIKESIVFFIIIVALISAGVLLTMMYPNKEHSLQMLNVKDSLMDNTPSPRIVFLSGSSFAFGLDSHRIEDSLHVNVVNAGLDAGLGLRFILDEAFPHLRKGDNIVVNMEYPHLTYQMHGDAPALAVANIYTHFRYFSTMTNKQKFDVIALIPASLRAIRNEVIPYDTYSVHAFNRWGDQYIHWTRPPKKQLNIPIYKGREMNEEYVSELLERLRRMRSAGMNVIITPAALTEKVADRPLIEETSRLLEKNGFPLCIDPYSVIYPKDIFYDSDYHLNKSGVDQYTLLLIDALKDKIHVSR